MIFKVICLCCDDENTVCDFEKNIEATTIKEAIKKASRFHKGSIVVGPTIFRPCFNPRLGVTDSWSSRRVNPRIGRGKK